MKYIIKTDNQKIFQNRFYDFETEVLVSPIETQNYTVVQVAHSYYSNGFSIGNHHQICDLELTFSLVNGLECSINDRIEKVDKHGLHLCFSQEMHALKSIKSARFQTLAVNFKEGHCSSLLHAIKEKAKGKRTFYVPEVFSCLNELVTEFTRSDVPFLEYHLDCLITSVLVKLLRSGNATTLDEIPSYDLKLSSMKNYIDSHFLQMHSLDEMSYVFGYTYSHISKIFKKTYGVTPNDYLLSKKMEYAVDLLQEGAKLEEIADVTGYSSPYNFSRAFKTYVGVSPSVYRKKFK